MTVESLSAAAERTRIVASHEIEAIRDSGGLDDLTAFAAALCNAPIALVTLIAHDEQHFVGRRGTDLTGTPLGISFCTIALGGTDLVEVTDASRDPRFADNPLVTGDHNVRFYAGAPLLTPDGLAIGTLCVLDTKPREGLTPLQRDGLVVLARAAIDRLDDRRGIRERRLADAAARATLEDSERRFRTLADTMPQMVWSTLPDGFHDYYNARWYEFTGMPEGSTDGEAWNGMFHPDDQDRAWTAWRHSLVTGDPYSIEYRLRHHDGSYRWVLGRALPMRGDDGAITRWFGTCTDIHEQKLASEEREVISQELSHRIKNIFAVVAGLIAFAARSRPEFAPMASDLRQRITALGRAHDFVRPHSAQSRPSARQDSLHGLLGELFAPYAEATGQRIVVTGDDLAIDDRSATPLALLFHELATNATKYGALSVGDGRVEIGVTTTPADATVIWQETGGPATTAPTGQAGFGTQLIEMSAVRQMGGAVVRDWTPDGLVVTLSIPLSSLSRS